MFDAVPSLLFEDGIVLSVKFAFPPAVVGKGF